MHGVVGEIGRDTRWAPECDGPGANPAVHCQDCPSTWRKRVVLGDHISLGHVYMAIRSKCKILARRVVGEAGYLDSSASIEFHELVIFIKVCVLKVPDCVKVAV